MLYFDVNKRDWKNDEKSDYQKVKAFIEINYPDAPVTYRNDGIIELDKNLTAAQKTNVKNQIIALLDG